MYAALRFDLIKGRSIPAPQFQTPGPLTPLVEHIRTTYGLEPVEAYVLASLVVDLKISEIVDQPNWIVVFAVGHLWIAERDPEVVILGRSLLISTP